MATRMRAVLALARTAVLRLLRDRSNLFFVFIFPILLIVLIGVQFSDPTGFRLLVFVPDDGGALAEELVDTLDSRDDLTVLRASTSQEASDGVSWGVADGALLLPGRYTQALTSSRTAEVGFVATPDSAGPALRTIVSAVVGDQGTLLAATTVLVASTELDFPDALIRARSAAAAVPGFEVERTVVGVNELAAEFEGLGQFDLGASQQLALFVFVTSLSAAAALIQSRELGVSRRLLASPVTSTTIVIGELLGRFGVALFQALYIVIGTAIVFGVRWGDPLGAALLVSSFSMVAAGAAMLLGSVLDTPSQAAGAGVGIGLGISALGGSMLPIELMPETIQQVAKVTPHAWLLDGFADLVRRGARVTDVLPQIGVLLGMALVLGLLASWTFQRKLRQHG